MENPLMNKPRVIFLLVTALVIAFCVTPNVKAANSDGVMMHDSKMVMMKAGKATGPMRRAISMSNGATVMTDGTVKTKAGRETRMKEGQIMMMDGHMMEGGNSGMMGGASTAGMGH